MDSPWNQFHQLSTSKCKQHTTAVFDPKQSTSALSSLEQALIPLISSLSTRNRQPSYENFRQRTASEETKRAAYNKEETDLLYQHSLDYCSARTRDFILNPAC
ncbi:hypothetical protein E3N88_07055 [Mikania micrantha]|uniref:Uncharacterized protein n=1 Tax=Mikania micrantha TaxID=192012 RepID=A0A5N6PTA2_9ASTR|nr:hypothetical protein E3N88_07055 [Mikania micrantha]